MTKHDNDHVHGQREKRVSVLENSIYYFLECVFIEKREGKYRLVVTHQKHVLTDLLYDTTRGARIAFTKFYRDKAWKEGIKPIWSPFYQPDRVWIATKLPENFSI
jgi:hypothetical protein